MNILYYHFKEGRNRPQHGMASSKSCPGHVQSRELPLSPGPSASPAPSPPPPLTGASLPCCSELPVTLGSRHLLDSYNHGCHRVATRLPGVAAAELSRCVYGPLAESTGHLEGAKVAVWGDPGSALPDHQVQLLELVPRGRRRDPSLICPGPLCKPEAVSSRAPSSRERPVQPFGP